MLLHEGPRLGIPGSAGSIPNITSGIHQLQPPRLGWDAPELSPPCRWQHGDLGRDVLIHVPSLPESSWTASRGFTLDAGHGPGSHQVALILLGSYFLIQNVFSTL